MGIGLKALNSGAITKAEFLDLNEKIGGRDVDGNIVSARSSGDPEAIERAYRHGRVTSGERWTLPIIHTRDYRDFNNDIHTRWPGSWPRWAAPSGECPLPGPTL